MDLEKNYKLILTSLTYQQNLKWNPRTEKKIQNFFNPSRLQAWVNINNQYKKAQSKEIQQGHFYLHAQIGNDAKNFICQQNFIS